MQAIDSPDGLFHDGNPATGAMGTVVTSDWLNAIQGELVSLVQGLGGTLDPAKRNQISTLLATALGSRPTGTDLATELAKKLGKSEKAADSAALDGHAADYFARAADLAKASGIPLLFPLWCPNRAAIPAGYAPADGQTLARSLYPDAWAGIAAGNVPTVADASWLSTPTERGKFTAGDGATTFRLPDYNGRAAGSLGALFQRGDGAMSAGVDGVIQADALQNITGQFRAMDGETSGAFSQGIQNGNVSGGSILRYNYLFDASRVARTATETRPLNITGCWAIRLFGAVTNPGAADAAQLATEVTKLQSDKVPFAAFLGASQSLTANGYQKLPGGLIIQWGTAAEGVTTSFPVSFPNACFSIVATFKLDAYNTTGTQAYAVSNSQFRVYVGASSGDFASWIAVGY